MGGQNAALERWRSRAVHEVTLPSGMRAQVRVPAAEKLATDSRVPSHLRIKALQFATSIIRTEQLDEDGLREMLDLQAHLTAMALVGLYDESTEQYDTVTLTPEQVWALELPSEDLDALEAIALRRLTPAQVTAQAQLMAGLITPEQKRQVDQQEAEGTVGAYGPFRPESGRPDNGSDGTEVRPVPSEGLPADQRSSDSVGG